MKSEANKSKLRYEKSLKMTEAQKQQIAGEIGEFLSTIYPGHLWAVNINQRIVTVQNLFLDNRMGFTLRLDHIGPEMKEVMRAGGELLERYRQKRGWADHEAINHAQRDFLGNVIHDD